MRTTTLPDDSKQLVSDAVVEFVASHNIERLFGLTAHRARMLALEGKIRAVHVKRPGAAYGLRIYEASIRPGVPAPELRETAEANQESGIPRATTSRQTMSDPSPLSQIPLTIAGPILITKADLSKAIKTSTRTIDTWREDGIIPFIKIGGVVRFDLAKVMAALEKRFEVQAKVSGGTIRRRPV